MSQWRPIASAPKDGRRVQLKGPRGGKYWAAWCSNVWGVFGWHVRDGRDLYATSSDYWWDSSEPA